MARIIIALLNDFPFSTIIPVRITDLNYGGHVGNDTLLSIIHEARMQFLKSYGYSEIDLGGVGLIMGDVAVAFKQELFYGDQVRVWVGVSEATRASFDIIYKLEKEKDGKMADVAHAKTGMVCFDYEHRKVTSIPEEVKKAWAIS
jgi:acyl-CoA thioester hydrolase